MERRRFLQSIALLSASSVFLNFKSTNPMNTTEKMPMLFVGHGSPMNAIETNEFSQTWANVAQSLPTPKAILCISAHWETKGTFVTAMKNPRTIHDFGGFPKALFDVEYPALGNPQLAEETRNMLKKTMVGLDSNWGFDHGCWSVIRQMYPKANIPLIQLSLDYTQNPQYHFELAKELASLREQGILIVGSGNIVHNLSKVDWRNLNMIFGYDWALEVDEKVKKLIEDGNFQALINYKSLGKSFELAIPTPEHFLPLLYILSLKQTNEKISFFNDKAVAGSLTMTSVKIE